MSTTYDAILGGKKIRRRKQAAKIPNGYVPDRSIVIDDYGKPMNDKQMENAAVLTSDQIAQRSGINVVNTPTTTQQGVQQNVVTTPSATSTPTATTTPTTTTTATTAQGQQGQQVQQVQQQGATPMYNPAAEVRKMVDEKVNSGQPTTDERIDQMMRGCVGVNDADEDELRKKAGLDTETTADDTIESPEDGVHSYDDIFKAMQEMQKYYKSRLESDEDREKREKREKRERLFANISDGLAAMHEAYSRARGIEPWVKPTAGKEVSERQKAAEAIRDKQYKDYLTNYLNIMQQQRLYEKDKANSEYKRGVLRMKSQQTEQQLRKLDAEIDKLIAQGKTEEARQKSMEAQTLYTLSRLEGQNITNQFAPDYWSAKIGQANRSNTGKSGGSGKSSKGGSSGKSNQPSYVEERDDRGRVVKTTETFYNENGEKVTKTTDRYGKTTTKTSGKGSIPQRKK